MLTEPSGDDLPIPADLALDGPAPFTDEDLDAAFDVLADDQWIETLGSLDPAEIQDDHPDRDAVVRVAAFAVLDEEQAEWAARKYAGIEAARGQAEAQAARWRAQIDEWEHEQTKRLQSRASFFEHALAGYALRRRAEDPKRNATTSLPSAVISTRAQNKGGRIDVVDPDAVIGWAETSLQGDEYESVIQTRTSVVLTEFRKAARIVPGPVPDDAPEGYVPDPIVVDDGGQVIPGVKVTPEGVTVTVKAR